MTNQRRTEQAAASVSDTGKQRQIKGNGQPLKLPVSFYLLILATHAFVSPV